MIKTIDGKIQHLRELEFIERHSGNRLSAELYYQSLKEYFTKNKEIGEKPYLSLEEVIKIDDFTRDYFYKRIPEFQTSIIRAYVIGRLLAKSDNEAKIFNIELLSRMPQTVKQAIKEFKLTKEQGLQLQAIIEKAGVNITSTTAETIKLVKKALFDSVSQDEGISGAEKRIRESILEDEGELNRDWKRVVITEVNNSFNNGYLSKCKEGDWVIGISMPDCCNFCFENIKGKVFKVISKPASEEDWKDKVWVGKNNIHRSTAERKRINPNIGNKKSNLRVRAEIEKSAPSCPAHPYCRCRYGRFFADLEYIDEEGNIRLKYENQEAYQNWYNDNILGR